MKQKLLVMLLSGFISTAVMAQDGSKKLFSNPALQQVSELKSLSEQIGKAETAAATTSRGNAAAAQEKVTALYASYAKELQNQKSLHAKDAAFVASVNEELSLVATKEQVKSK